MVKSVIPVLVFLFLLPVVTFSQSISNSSKYQGTNPILEDSVYSFMSIGYLGSFRLGKQGEMGLKNTQSIHIGLNLFYKRFSFSVHDNISFGIIDREGFRKYVNSEFSGVVIDEKAIYSIDKLKGNSFMLGNKFAADGGYAFLASKKQRFDYLIGLSIHFSFFRINADEGFEVTYSDGTKSSNLTFTSRPNFVVNTELYTGLAYTRFINKKISFSSSLKIGGVQSIWFNYASISKENGTNGMEYETEKYFFQTLSNQAQVSQKVAVLLNIDEFF
ncbi:hypothetical protein [Salibacter halophilus]|uniref:Uncharacterized protein n=1 Tax=Salibacter halophilus TaxID=1803916 RepID=A0A6N6M7Y0_9FLAO|nr:hypothetical protein [Salibacter halophilus]KAB1066004.1 hypothetical protein F3059_00600 [Salibacter halophilus]